MIRFLFRFTGFWLVAAAVVAVVIDGAKSIAASEVVTTPLGATWSQLAPASLTETQSLIEDQLAQPWLWGLLNDWVLSAPVWLAIGVLGLILMVLGRRRRQRTLGEEGYI